VFVEDSKKILTKKELKTMVSGISSTSAYQYKPEMRESVSLTEDQKASVQEIVSKYDSENMTADSMKSMMDEIKDLGFSPSEDVKTILENAGFKKPADMPPPPDGQGKGARVDGSYVPDFITEFLQKQENGEVTQLDYEQLSQNLKNNDETTNGIFIDKSV
jgi:hypothetical protein